MRKSISFKLSVSVLLILWTMSVCAQSIRQKTNTLSRADSSAMNVRNDTIVEMRIDANGDTTYVFRFVPIIPSVGPSDESAGNCVEARIRNTNALLSARTPAAGSYVGKIPFTEDVSPTGARTYAIPVATANDCPLKPSVSITYNSQTGNGVAGYGWNLTAASAITLVNRTILHDGIAGASDISAPSECAFALDGVRLVENTGQLPQYQYETAHGFILVQKHMSDNNIAYFTAAYPDGSTATFGFKDNTQTSIAYPMTELTDMKGNRIDFSYIQSGNNYYISKIEYGGKSAAEHTAEIEFTYSERNDFTTVYTASVPVSADRLLKGIVSRNSVGGIMHELCSYTLAHEPDGVSRLVQIDCSSDQSSLEPLRFSYGASASSDVDDFAERGKCFIDKSFSSDALPVYIRGKFVKNQYEDGLVTLPGRFSPYTNIGVDSKKSPIFGSGYPADQQILAVPRCDVYSGTLSIMTEDGFQTIQAVDAGGDGTDELVKVNFAGISGSNTNLKITVYTYNTGAFSPKSFTIPVYGVVDNGGNTKCPMSHEYLFGSFKGDGKVQLLTVSHDKDFLGKNRESRFTLIDIDGKKKEYEGTLFPFATSDMKYTWVADVNGDGKAELCHATGTAIDVYAYTGNRFERLFSSNIDKSVCAEAVLGDLNGDGKIDFITPPEASYWDNSLREIPVWSPQRCPYCSGHMPIIQSDATSCRHCGRDLLGYCNQLAAQDMLQCYVCGQTLQTTGAFAPGDFPSCPTHGIVYTENEPMYVDNGDRWKAFIATGSRFAPKDMRIARRDVNDRYILMDVDSDGLSDLVCLRNDTARVLANRFGTIQPSVVCIRPMPASRHILPANVCNIYGMSRFVTVSDATITCYSYQRQCNRENLLTGMTDSYGNVHTNEYADLADASHDTYSVSGSYEYPYASLVVPLNILTGAEVYSGRDIGTSSRTAFRYGDAVFHCQGLGFIGFGTKTAEDLIANTTNTETHDPKMFGVIVGTDSPEKETHILYVCDTAGGKMNPQPVSTTETNLLTGVTVETDVTYDTYNNPMRKRTMYGPSLQTIQTYTYDNIVTPSCYIVGLPTSATTQNLRDGQTWTAKTVTTYNDSHMPSSRIDYVEGNKTGETRWTYDTNGNVTSELSAPYDATTFTGTTFTYDADGRHVLSVTNALGQKTDYADYDKFGCACTITDFMQRTTRRVQDTWGTTISTTYPDGTEEHALATWGGEGLYTVTTTHTGQPSTTIHYDALAREIRTGSMRPDGEWQLADKRYDNRGRLHMASLPFTGTSPTKWNVYDYDEYDRPVSLTEASGKVTRWSYDGLSTTETHNGMVSVKTRDATGALVKAEDAGGTITYTLRPDGQPSAITAPGNIVTSFGYDGYGRRTSVDDPSFGRQTFSEKYESDGTCVQTTTDADGRTVTTTIDPYGRKTSEKRPEFSTEWKYNADGNLAEEHSDNGVLTTFAYDALGRLHETAKSYEGRSITKRLAYSDGNVSSKTITVCSGNDQPSQVTEQYEYSNGTLVKTTLGNTSTVVCELQGQNALGQITRVLTGGMTREYTFDDSGLLLARRAGTVQRVSYEFDPHTGNLMRRTDDTRGLAETFGYDGMCRLTDMNGKAIAYADNGNIMKMDGIGEMEYQHTSKPYAMTDLYRTATNGDRTAQDISYNSFHCPESIVQGNASLSFTYDASGNRVKSSGVSVRYYLDEYETFETENKEILYLGGDAYTAPVAYVRIGGGEWKLVNICRDHLGSVTHIADESGTLIAEYSYDAWGRMRNPDTHEAYAFGAEPELYLGRGYTGHEHLPQFGLINMNARLYDPETGRFLSPDPYVQQPDFTQNLNRYSYCVNNPLKYTDTSGEWFILDDILIGGVGFVVGYISHGLSTGNWGWDAVKSGFGYAVSSWLLYNTAGLTAGTTIASAWHYAVGIGVNALLGNLLPSFDIQLGNFNISLSPTTALGENGLTYGFSASVYVSFGKFTMGGGYGVTNKYRGWNSSASVSGWGGGYGRTYYKSDVVGDNYLGKQTVGTISLQFGDNVSFRISNDLWGDKEDRWRTSAAELTVGSISVGTFVTTNNGKKASGYIENGNLETDMKAQPLKNKDSILGENPYKFYEDEFKKIRAKGGGWKNGEVYRAPLWVGLKSGRQIRRFGVSSMSVQSLTQNFVHKYISKTAFFIGKNEFKGGPYSYLGTYSAYSIF